jgi:hypothetical protein
MDVGGGDQPSIALCGTISQPWMRRGSPQFRSLPIFLRRSSMRSRPPFATDPIQVTDGSKASVSVDPTAIPWVRLSAASTTPGQLGNITNIQRIATAGGLAPPVADCDRIRVGTVAEVPYTADYYFWQ